MASMYILKCGDGSYYTGSTFNLEKRLEEHKNPKLCAKYTKARQPVELVYHEDFERVEDAFKCEKQVQGWSRSKKEALIKGEFNKLPLLSASKTGVSVPEPVEGV